MTAVRDPRAQVFADLAAAAITHAVDRLELRLRPDAPEKWAVIRVTAGGAGTLLDFQAEDGLSATFVKGDLR